MGLSGESVLDNNYGSYFSFWPSGNYLNYKTSIFGLNQTLTCSLRFDIFLEKMTLSEYQLKLTPRFAHVK